MFQSILPCSSLKQANAMRRLIARTFRIPICALLAQHDIAGGGKTPAVLYSPQIHRAEHRKTVQTPDNFPILNTWEQEEKVRELVEKIQPFFRGYFSGRRSGR